MPRMEQLRLIVGLGNPGAEYARTRHNVGFVVVQLLVERWQAHWAMQRRFHSRVARAKRAERRVLLVQPQTFMNASGEAVAAMTAFYRIEPGGVLAIVDDADLPLGEIRLRPSGGTGGHHGLESLTQHLGTSEVSRLRIGIGRQAEAREITGHVLGRFTQAEAEIMEKVLRVAADQAQCWLEVGVQKAMNDFNGVVLPSESEGNKQ